MAERELPVDEIVRTETLSVSFENGLKIPLRNNRSGGNTDPEESLRVSDARGLATDSRLTGK